jgi:hypothetical protein
MGDGDHDQGDEEPEPVASSTSDATSGTRRSRLAFRSVVSALLSGWETFLHSLKAVLGPAARGAAGDGGPAGTPTHRALHAGDLEVANPKWRGGIASALAITAVGVDVPPVVPSPPHGTVRRDGDHTTTGGGT